MLSRLGAVLFICATVVMGGIEPKVTYRFEPDGFHGDSTMLIVHVGLPEGWHIQSSAPLDSFLIPTTLRAEANGLAFAKPIFPVAVEEDIPALGGKVSVFQGEFDIRMPLKRLAHKTDAAVLKNVKVMLRYQACSNTQCLPPKEITAHLDTLGKR